MCSGSIKPSSVCMCALVPFSFMISLLLTQSSICVAPPGYEKLSVCVCFALPIPTPALDQLPILQSAKGIAS